MSIPPGSCTSRHANVTAHATHWPTHRTDTFNATLQRLLGNDGWFDEPVGEEDRPSKHHVTGDNRAVIPL